MKNENNNAIANFFYFIMKFQYTFEISTRAKLFSNQHLFKVNLDDLESTFKRYREEPDFFFRVLVTALAKSANARTSTLPVGSAHFNSRFV